MKPFSRSFSSRSFKLAISLPWLSADCVRVLLPAPLTQRYKTEPFCEIVKAEDGRLALQIQNGTIYIASLPAHSRNPHRTSTRSPSDRISRRSTSRSNPVPASITAVLQSAQRSATADEAEPRIDTRGAHFSAGRSERAAAEKPQCLIPGAGTASREGPPLAVHRRRGGTFEEYLTSAVGPGSDRETQFNKSC